jgi:xylulokinase
MMPLICALLLLLLLFIPTNAAMDSPHCYLGLDVGTQGFKCLAYCPSQQKVVARASVSYGLNPTDVPGRAEQDPVVWLQALEDCFEVIREELSTHEYAIKGVGVSGQQHGMVALDTNCSPLRAAKLWCDVEATEETRYLIENSRDICDRSYLTAGFTSPKILWMKRNEPELFAQAKWFVLPHDYVTLRLASLTEPITDAGDASGNGILDTSTRANMPELANLIDPNLIQKLPKVLGPNEIAGYMNPRYLEILGLDATEKVPISVGSGDNMCSALGVGCVREGRAVLSLGTSGTLFGVSRNPAPLNTPLAPFCDATGNHLPLACVMSCTGVLTQVLNEWCPDGWTHEDASEAAGNIPIGCHGLTFLPYLSGERTPNWPHATGALLGLTSQNFQQTPGLVYRACLEGITFLLADALHYFPSKVDTLYVVGGGARNPLWRQMIADVLNCKLVFPVEAESAALGAAFQAGAAATGQDVADYVLQQNIELEKETVEPKNHQEYQEAFERYRRLGKALFEQP